MPIKSKKTDDNTHRKKAVKLSVKVKKTKRKSKKDRVELLEKKISQLEEALEEGNYIHDEVQLEKIVDGYRKRHPEISDRNKRYFTAASVSFIMIIIVSLWFYTLSANFKAAQSVPDPKNNEIKNQLGNLKKEVNSMINQVNESFDEIDGTNEKNELEAKEKIEKLKNNLIKQIDIATTTVSTTTVATTTQKTKKE